MNNTLCFGSQWLLHPISEQARLHNLNDALSFGNHKGASNNKEMLHKLIKNDIIHGYSLPLPLDKIHRIPVIHIAPMNIAKQLTIDLSNAILLDNNWNHSELFFATATSSSSLRIPPRRHPFCRSTATNHQNTLRSSWRTQYVPR